jgi:hypothetical protein
MRPSPFDREYRWPIFASAFVNSAPTDSRRPMLKEYRIQTSLRIINVRLSQLDAGDRNSEDSG